MFNSVNNSVVWLWPPRPVLPLESTENTDCEGFSSSSSIPPRGFPLLEEGVLVVDGSRPPSFPLLALHPFQLEERRLPLAVFALFCAAARSAASSSGLCFAPSFLRWGRGRRASGRQRGRRRLRRTTGSAGQVWEQRQREEPVQEERGMRIKCDKKLRVMKIRCKIHKVWRETLSYDTC